MINRQCASKNRGFTLVETLLYIALFGILLTGVVMSAYPLITGADKLSVNVVEESEASFVFQKIEWALSSASAVSSPSSSELRVTRVGGGSVWFRQTGNFIEISEDVGISWFSLNATRAVVSSFTVSVVSGTPNTITVSFNVGSGVYSQTYNVFY